MADENIDENIEPQERVLTDDETASKFFHDVEVQLIWMAHKEKTMEIRKIGPNAEENRKLIENHAEMVEENDIHALQCNEIWNAGGRLLQIGHFTSYVVGVKLRSLRGAWEGYSLKFNKMSKEITYAQKVNLGNVYQLETDQAVLWINGRHARVLLTAYGADVASTDAFFLHHFAICLEVKDFLQTVTRLRHNGPICMMRENLLWPPVSEQDLLKLRQRNEDIFSAQLKLENAYDRLNELIATTNGKFVERYQEHSIFAENISSEEGLHLLEARGQQLKLERDRLFSEAGEPAVALELAVVKESSLFNKPVQELAAAEIVVAPGSSVQMDEAVDFQEENTNNKAHEGEGEARKRPQSAEEVDSSQKKRPKN
ncbi:hypothetical protein CAEBREN_19968 [Caenorhabditis brenneri]|uniref:Uncharacterized protein n=1 Tax=Caenorhabditis brenneri TaxID=135651 RepID=G0MX98_CAEBE|nr:hypothetical protein CAEBREN_19968 [Caenorhabditis brenneri]